MEPFRHAAAGLLAPFVLVIEGSDPERAHQRRGVLDLVRQRPRSPASRSRSTSGSTSSHRKRGPWSPLVRARRTAASTRWPATRPGSMGLADYLGWDFRSISRDCRSSTSSGCPIQADNFMETLVWLLQQAAGKAPMIPLDAQLLPVSWLFGKDGPRRLRSGRLLRAGRLRRPTTIRAAVPGEGRLLGAGRQLQCSQARLDRRRGRLPERRRHLHRLHDAGFPRSLHAVHGSTAPGPRWCRRR